jgi:dTDP-L-rhamnose 4-epimerase
MTRTVLITGGAGFIGSHVADEMLASGCAVRVLDSLLPQVHGEGRRRPPYLAKEVELVIGDIRDRDTVSRALAGVDVVFHFAARVGVGQSMYELSEYTSVNGIGTAVLLEQLAARPVRKLIVASSMSVYGEGLYRDDLEQLHDTVEREPRQLARGEWEPRSRDGRPLVPLPTPESKTPALASVYALSKYDQERMCMLVGSAYRIPTVALRFFNVYGPRQALSNPYTGVLAIFAARYMNHNRPLVFEDGKQMRDFVHVRDVATACRLACDEDGAAGHVINIGSGRAYTVLDIADRMAKVLGSSLRAEVTRKYRTGDIRHCTADIGLARRVLGFDPAIDLEQGLTDLARWLATQEAVDRCDEMRAQLTERGLAR